MDTPPVQYARTADDVDIAYTSAGDGDAVVWVPDGLWSHCAKVWEHPYWRDRIANLSCEGAQE